MYLNHQEWPTCLTSLSCYAKKSLSDPLFFARVLTPTDVMGSPAAVELISPFGAHPQKVGESFQVGDDKNQFKPLYRCEVLAIDNAARTATVRLTYRAAAEIPGPNQRPFDIGVIGSDAGGIYIQNGKVYRIPPYGPVMQEVIAHNEASTIRDTGIRSLTQATALTGLMRHAANALRALDPIRTPAPAPTRSHTNAKDGASNRRSEAKPKARPK